MIAIDTASATLATTPAPAMTACPGAAVRRARASRHSVERPAGSRGMIQAVAPGRPRMAPARISATAR